MSQIYVLHYIYGEALFNNTCICKSRVTILTKTANTKYVHTFGYYFVIMNNIPPPPSLQMIHIELLTKINQLLISYK